METTQFKFAGLGHRFLALVIDFTLFCAVFFPTTRIVKGVWLMTPADHIWRFGWFISDPLCVIFLFVIVTYFVLLEGLTGYTIGKRILGIRVVDLRGQQPGLSRSILRNVLRLVDGLPAFSLLGTILIVVTSERTRIGDIVARTRVTVDSRK